MKRETLLWSVLGLGLLIAGVLPLSAHEGPMHPAKPSSPELTALKKLAGKWTGTMPSADKNAKPSPISTTFKVTSNGTAIEETLGPGTESEMVDMYTDEGGKVAMTHYCAMGNQPHLVLKSAGPTFVELEMVSSVGIDAAKDLHMHSIRLEFPDANHLTERWTNYQGGKVGETAVFNFTRVQ